MWQHTGVSRKEAENFLRRREVDLEIERRRDVRSAWNGLQANGDPPAGGDTADQCGSFGRLSVAAEKKIANNLRCLEKIRDALEKIEDGTYGICEKCGKEISVKRLQTRPELELCVSCKEAQRRQRMMPAKNFNPYMQARA